MSIRVCITGTGLGHARYSLSFACAHRASTARDARQAMRRMLCFGKPAGIGKHRAPPREDTVSPAPAVPSPLPPGASVLRAGASAGMPPEPVHTHQPLVGVYTRPPPRPRHCRAESERAAPSRRHTQARAAPITRRADHQKLKRSVREVCSLRLSATSPQVEH